jgi:pyrophosphatase PpaX
MPFSVILFDLDGTLVDTNHLIVASFQHTLKEKLGLDVPASDLYGHFGEPLPITMDRYAPGRGEELTDFYRVFNQANHDQLIREFVGVREMVAALHATGIRLAVVTSKKTDLAKRGLRASGLSSFFSVVVGMDLTQRHKPEAEPALLALRQLETHPGSHVLMVGDSKYDILCGRNAGVKTAAVRWSVLDPEALAVHKPDYWVERPADLIGLAHGE